MQRNNDDQQPVAGGSKPSGSLDVLTQERATRSNAIEIPQISLPKGGGAIKGIDEKFQVNAANGTSAFSIPVPLSPNRNGFNPALSISYNSGAGNGILGLGWNLDFPSIQRKTDKKLPRYRDFSTQPEEEDVFMFSGVEDLTPKLKKDGQGWVPVETVQNDYRVQEYRPRIEGGFSRIERILPPDRGMYWRVTTRDNITTIFGRGKECRIADPEDDSRIFQWLPEMSFDDKGNLILFEYESENLDNVPDLIYEKNRHKGNARFSNRYLKRVKYGNKVPYYVEPGQSFDPPFPVDPEYFFELVVDYGEHRRFEALGDEETPNYEKQKTWPCRPDAFSTYRSGFEIRMYRRCYGALLFHHFKDEAEFGEKYLVRSLDFEYQPSSIDGSGQTEVSYLKAITQSGYIRKADGTYSKKSLPPLEFEYQRLQWNREVKNVDKESIVHAPVGLSNNYQWVDLYGEGISGILSEQAEGWFYKSNLSDVDMPGLVRFTHAKEVIPKPSFSGLATGVLSLQDLEADGQKQVVVNGAGVQGYFELTDGAGWQPFQSFEEIANIDLRDPNTRLIDLDGDGQPELVVTEENVFVWYAANGKKGHRPAETAGKTFDEERGPAIVFADQTQSIYLADMTGDGLTDIVRIRNGEICYWANRGYGRFSAKVNMSDAPLFDLPDQFNPQYLHLADVSGTGPTDMVYLGKNKFNAWLNLGGNAWSDAHEIEPFLPIDNHTRLSVIDLLGTGTSCIVWSSDLPDYAEAPMRYIDLMNSRKPHVMVSYKNNFGKEITLEYKSSTYFYLKDKLEGRPWITKLPFPVQVVSKTIVEEKITDVRFTSEYRYHHGYYDHAEREFRGFGMVEQVDTEAFDVFEKTGAANAVQPEHHQAPVLTKTWFHTGAFLDKTRILTQFKKEYWHEQYKEKGFATTAVEYELPDAVLLSADNLGDFNLDQLSAEEWREALRACKGMTLRKEIFGLDAEKRIADEKAAKEYADNDPVFGAFQARAKETEQVPYSVATHNCEIQLLQPRERNPHAVFIVKESEAIAYSYERNPEDPRIAHTLNIETDELGNVLESVSVVYPRLKEEELLQDDAGDTPAARKAKEAGRKAQKRQWITYTQNDFTQDLIAPDHYYLRKGWQTKTYELTGLKPAGNRPVFQISDFKGSAKALPEIEYQSEPAAGIAQKRLIENIKTKFYNAELTQPLVDGQMDFRGIPFEVYQLAYTPNLITEIFQPSAHSVQFEVCDADMTTGRFLQDDFNWWIKSGTVHYRRNGETLAAAEARFLFPVAYTDPFDSVTTVEYDPLNLFMQKSADALGNQTEVLRFNHRTLSPDIMRDLNDNLSSVVVDELGLVKAMALEGKAGNNDLQGEEADNLLGITEITEEAESQLIQDFFQLANTTAPNVCNYTQLQQIARTLLGNATARMVYDFSTQPTAVAGISREQHASQNPNNSPLQISFEYTDGLGKVAMKKVQAEPGIVTTPDGTEIDTGNQLRWVGNGRTVLNNKGNPIKQYEPYFSTTPAYENDPAWVQQGVTPVFYYDGAGRNVKTELPNGTFTKVLFDAWKQCSYDVNDTVLDSQWYAQRQGLDNNNPEKKAAQKSAVHADTPSCLITDTLGRPILGIDHNRWEDADGNIREEFTYTYSELDIEGNALSVTDARGNMVMAWRYDMLGHRVAQISMDAGKRWILNNALGNPVKTWDERAHEFAFEYDVLHRPTIKRIKGGDGTIPLNHTYERIIYGENRPNDKQNNLRGKAAILYDTAGKVISDTYDFKGNLLSSTRVFAKDYKNMPNWEAADPDGLLEGTDYSFTTRSEYDALNRVLRQTTPDGKITSPGYNPSGFLEKVTLYEGDRTTEFVKNIDYDAKGQRTRIQYGNDVHTQYQYDPETFRLIQLRSAKNGGEVLQDLKYTYDPNGNITQIEDQAVPTVFFNNQKIAGRNEYTYDALYRLIAASGREQHTNAPNFDAADNWNDAYALFAHNSGDPMAMRTYTQRYQYDGAGNIQQMRHEAGANGSWTRDYAYETQNNRLKSTAVGSNTYLYPHHARHGYMTAMPHLQLMHWTFKEELQATAKQRRTDGGSPETTWYVYDGAGQRVRKVTENQADAGATPGKKDERLYIGGYERYKNENGLERETLHIMDNKQRIAMLDTETEPRRTAGMPAGDAAPVRTQRYQMGNHLGSVSLETDENAGVISYEEYHPYGTTAYQAMNRDIKAAAKRYRYTGLERDEENGLNYHGARYYAGWLGRWISDDPKGMVDGGNLYHYSGNPLIHIDLTGNQQTSQKNISSIEGQPPPGNIRVSGGGSNDLSGGGYLPPPPHYELEVPFSMTSTNSDKGLTNAVSLRVSGVIEELGLLLEGEVFYDMYTPQHSRIIEDEGSETGKRYIAPPYQFFTFLGGRLMLAYSKEVSNGFSLTVGASLEGGINAPNRIGKPVQDWIHINISHSPLWDYPDADVMEVYAAVGAIVGASYDFLRVDKTRVTLHAGVTGDYGTHSKSVGFYGSIRLETECCFISTGLSFQETSTQVLSTAKSGEEQEGMRTIWNMQAGVNVADDIQLTLGNVTELDTIDPTLNQNRFIVGLTYKFKK